MENDSVITTFVKKKLVISAINIRKECIIYCLLLNNFVMKNIYSNVRIHYFKHEKYQQQQK